MTGTFKSVCLALWHNSIELEQKTAIPTYKVPPRPLHSHNLSKYVRNLSQHNPNTHYYKYDSTKCLPPGSQPRRTHLESLDRGTTQSAQART
eukprot:1758329-Amphidinium_carterae.1